MNAPLSKRVREILSNPKDARHLIRQSMRVQCGLESEPVIFKEESYKVIRVPKNKQT